jgi:hypothetical protein
MPVISSLLVALPLALAGDELKLPEIGPWEGVGNAAWRRSDHHSSDSLTGMTSCRAGDRSWLLFTTQTPADWEPKLPCLDIAAWMVGHPATGAGTWLVEIDRKGKPVGGPRKVVLPPHSNYADSLTHLGGDCLGCAYHDGKLICLNPEGVLFGIPTEDGKKKTTVECSDVHSIDARQLAADFCDDAKQIAIVSLQVNGAGDPEVYVEIERKGGKRLLVRKAFAWDNLACGHNGTVYPKVPKLFYLGEVTDGQRLSAAYERETNDLLLFNAKTAELVRQAPLLDNKRYDDLKKGVEQFKAAERDIAESLSTLFKPEGTPKKPPPPGVPLEIKPYGMILQDDRINLGMAGLFQAVDVGGKAYCLFVDVGENKLLVRPYDKGKLGEAVAAPSEGDVFDYKTAVIGKKLFAFTVEMKHRDKDNRKSHAEDRCFFHTYRFDGAAWEQLDDWRHEEDSRSLLGLPVNLLDSIPNFQPVVIGDNVYVYHVAKWHKTDLPKVHRDKVDDD